MCNAAAAVILGRGHAERFLEGATEMVSAEARHFRERIKCDRFSDMVLDVCRYLTLLTRRETALGGRLGGGTTVIGIEKFVGEHGPERFEIRAATTSRA